MKTMLRNKDNTQIYVYTILLVIMAFGILLRLPSVTYNLPVASSADERTGLRILYRFENSSLNPEFFNWPAFYYYLTYFTTKPFISSFEEIILYGRVLNLLLGCFLIALVFLIGKVSLQSDEAGLMAALFIASSPILIGNGSYIATDILLAILSLLSLFFFSIFFQNADYKYWFAGVLMAGLAISAKYTAVLLALTYVLFEFFFSRNHANSKNSNNLLERRFSLWWLSVGVLVIGILCLAFYIFFPSDLILSFIEGQGGVNSTLDPKDIELIKSFKSKLLLLAFLLGAVLLLSLRFKSFFSRFCYSRPYVGLILIVLFFVLGSPFSLISWKDFVYDFGSVLKANALSSNEQQWLNFIGGYLYYESVIVLAFFPLGIYWLVKHRQPFTLLGIYLVIYYVYHGSATRVFSRYWTPILPVVFVISAYGVYSTSHLLKDKRWRYVGFLLLVTVCVGLELWPKYSSFVSRRLEAENSMYESYHWILNKEPSRVYYSPYIPDVELRSKGLDLIEIPKSWVTTDASLLLQRMRPNDVLMIDGRLESQMSATLRQNLSLEWSSEKDYGQYIYHK